jgi:hypothetical protein
MDVSRVLRVTVAVRVMAAAAYHVARAAGKQRPRRATPEPVMSPLILLAAALALLALFAFVVHGILTRGLARRADVGRDVVTAHWESLVMQRRDLRLAVDALGVPTLHGRVGPVAYTIQVSAPDGPWGGRPLAHASGLADAARITLARKGERELPVPALPAALTTGDEEFDAVFDARCDDPDSARARIGREVRAPLLAIPGAFAWVDPGGLRIDLGASATRIDHALLDALRDVLQGIAAASPPAVAAG